MKKIFYLPIVAIVAGLLLCTACKKKVVEEETNEVRTENSEEQKITEENFKSIPLDQYLSGTWVLEDNFHSIDIACIDTIIFSNGTFVCNCNDSVPYLTPIVYYPYNNETPLNDTAYFTKLFIERLDINKILIYNYHPCYDYTCVVKNSVFNRIN